MIRSADRQSPSSRARRALAALALIACAPQAAAAEITGVVATFLEHEVSEPGASVSIDVREPRADFPPCDRPQPFLPANGQRLRGRVTVGVRCGEARRVRYLQAEVRVVGGYWVAARRIEAGSAIVPEMLEPARGDLATLPRDVVRDRQAAVGRVAARPIAQGSVVRGQQLREERIVQRRQAVTVIAEGEGFRVSRQGEALQSGGLGDEVRVRLSNREVIDATVSGRGRVRVDF